MISYGYKTIKEAEEERSETLSGGRAVGMVQGVPGDYYFFIANRKNEDKRRN